MPGEDYEKKNRRVERALFRAATGYKVKLKKPTKVKEETNRPGEGKLVCERVVLETEEKYVEPKITAAIFWLKSRMPEKWGNGELELCEGKQEMRPVLETYADLLENPAAGRELEEEDGQDSFCAADREAGAVY